jgi:hypothetical protein
MKKLVIITDGCRLRGFRLIDRQRGDDLSLHCTEIHTLCLCEEATADQAAELEELAGRISDLINDEQPALWNLAAPREVIDPVVRLLRSEARSRLTRTQVCNLIDANLTEIALRFPPTPCQAPVVRGEVVRGRTVAAGAA